MPSRDVQPIENICLMKLFLGNVGQIDQVVEQGTVIRLVFEGSQGIVDKKDIVDYKSILLFASFILKGLYKSQGLIEHIGHGFDGRI